MNSKPKLPTPAELEEARHEMSNALLMMSEQMTPVFDAADGIKADMEKRGWSPTAAEQVALTWLIGAMGNIASAS